MMRDYFLCYIVFHYQDPCILTTCTVYCQFSTPPIVILEAERNHCDHCVAVWPISRQISQMRNFIIKHI